MAVQILRFYNIRYADLYEVNDADQDDVLKLIADGDEESLAKADDIVVNNRMLISTMADIDEENEMVSLAVLNESR